MIINVRRALVAAGAAGACVAGIGVAAVAGGTAAGAASGRAPVSYRVDSDGQIHGPSHLAPGVVSIKMYGYATRQLQFVRPYRSSYSKQKLADDANMAIGQSKPQALEASFALTGGGNPHNTVYVNLAAGKYYLVNIGGSAVQAKNIQTLTVSGARSNASIPNGPRIEALGMHSWGHAPGTIPQSGTLRFVNGASDTHFIEIDRLKNGKTIKDVQKVIQGKENPSDVFVSSPPSAHNNFSEAVVSPGSSEASSYYLNKGNYAILCFFPDHKTGEPHAYEGMYRGIKVA